MQITAHDAFSALINLSDSPPVVEQLSDPDFLSMIFYTIIVSDCKYTWKSMLVSRLTHILLLFFT
jgi:hypothetical protein